MCIWIIDSFGVRLLYGVNNFLRVIKRKDTLIMIVITNTSLNVTKLIRRNPNNSKINGNMIEESKIRLARLISKMIVDNLTSSF